MIWKSVRHVTFTEVTTGIIFLLMTAGLGSLGLLSGSKTVAAILVALWFALFLVAYRVRYGRV